MAYSMDSSTAREKGSSAERAHLPIHPMNKETIKWHLREMPDLQNKVNVWMRTGYVEIRHLGDAVQTTMSIRGAYQEYSTPQIVVMVNDCNHKDTYHLVCPREVGCDPHYDEFRQRGIARSAAIQRAVDAEHARDAAEVEERIRRRREEEAKRKKD